MTTVGSTESAGARVVAGTQVVVGPGRLSRIVTVLLPPLVTAAIGLIGWQLLASRPGTSLTGPIDTFRTLFELTFNGQLVSDVGRTLALMGIGFTGSAIAGVLVGLWLGYSSLADRGLSPYLVGLQSLPSAVWIPLAVLVGGTNVSSVIAVTVLGAIPSIAIGTRDAVHTIPPLVIRAAQTLGAHGRVMMRRVVVPAALPGIVDGLQHGWAFAFRSLIAAELILGTGIGAFLGVAKREDRVDKVLSVVIAILIVGLVIDRLGFARVRRQLRRRRGLPVAGGLL
jgi:NitT/TauT family transport system permease protein